MKQWRQGDLDVWEPVVGKNGAGKSTLCRGRVAMYAAQGIRVLVSDPDGQFKQFGDAFGTTLAYRKFLRGTDKAPMVARFGPKVPIGEVFALAREMSAATEHRTPLMVMVDEGSAWTKATIRSRANEELLEAIARRRNEAVGAIIIYQQPTMLHYYNLTNATRIFVFRIESGHQIRHLRDCLPDRVKLADGREYDADLLCKALPTLPRGAHYEIDKSF